MRLSPRQWLAALAIILGCAWGIRGSGSSSSDSTPGPTTASPTQLSKDYWLYQRRLERIADPATVPVLGDSVVWGEYVRPDGTLPHFLEPGDRPARSLRQLRRQRPVPAGAWKGSCEHYGRRLRGPQDHRPLQRAVDEQPQGRPEREEGRGVQPFPAGAAVLRRGFPATGPTRPSGSAR